MREYRIEPLPDGRFAVVTRRGERVHTGTLEECSDWLDRREVGGPNSHPPTPSTIDPHGPTEPRTA